MSASYQPVSWNKFKKQYDVALWATIVLYLGIFIGCTVVKYPAQNLNTTLIRAFGTLAFLLLHVILMIGPLCRLSDKFLPVLYNRRHLGVSMFMLALVHSLLSLVHFHGNGNEHVLISLFTANLHYNSLLFFPFQTLGFIALIILAAMAFTSHDFWLHFLGPGFWKIMHMLVYVAYGLILLHVALGIIQFEKSPFLVSCLVAGFFAVAGLHLWAGLKEVKEDHRGGNLLTEGWNFVCQVNEIGDDKAKLVNIGEDRVAIFKYDGKLSAVHNVCKHQMGPLGEGKVVNGCITCPWHGYQYRPEDGCAPSPFTEKIATYRLQLRGSDVYVNINALPEGTYVEPVVLADGSQGNELLPFFVGWAKNQWPLFTATRLIAIVMSFSIFVIGIVLSTSQQNISGFAIDYNNVKKLEGWLSEIPVPNLKIIDSKDADGNPLYKTILLVDAFKFGADATVKKVLNGGSGKYVSVNGYVSSNIHGCSDSSLDCIELCNNCIIGTTDNPVMEIENGRYSFEEKEAPLPQVIDTKIIGKKVLRGEIIDPKCYFGAMNPGMGKAHLSCAARCISGGIMPVLKYEVNHKNRYAVLVGLDGEKVNHVLLNLIGVPVEIEGDLYAMGNWDILKIDTKKNIVRVEENGFR